MDNKKEYNTKALELIERCLKQQNGKHLTAEQIKYKLAQKGEHIGTATVYRNLEKLINAGRVQKYTGGESACFAASSEGCHDHFHLRCSKCGKLIHMECSHMDALSEHICAEHGFVVDKFKTVLYGLCEECRD